MNRFGPTRSLPPVRGHAIADMVEYYGQLARQDLLTRLGFGS
jgi:hypothetical protein